jgi:N-acetylglucosaminyl-diphospho-decaprenol L-rhamnosyltransferase
VDTSASPRSPFSLALSVIVVSADSGTSLRDCVRQLLTGDTPLQLILVDNDSRDGVPEAIERAYAHDARLSVIYNHRNTGFGPAVNQGVKQAHGHAVLVLNPDCLLQPEDITRLLAVLASRPKAGVIGAVVVDADGRPDPASWRRDPLLHRALNSMLGRDGERVNIEAEIPHEVVEAEAVSGAAMLMSRATFQRLGGFDEGYFLHCEDLDLCRRARDLGYQVLLAGDVRVHHGKGGSSRHRPVFVSRHKHRGMWRWFRSHDPAAGNPFTSILVWVGIWLHFLVKVPGQCLKAWRAPKVQQLPPSRDD